MIEDLHIHKFVPFDVAHTLSTHQYVLIRALKENPFFFFFSFSELKKKKEKKRENLRAFTMENAILSHFIILKATLSIIPYQFTIHPTS